MSYIQVLFHFIFRTKYNIPAISERYENDLYAYIAGFIKNKKSKLHCINGMPEHLHIFTDLHPSLSISGFVRDLKISTSKWLYQNQAKFPLFRGWGTGYAVFAYNKKDAQMIINYIKGQKTHHRGENFAAEYRRLIIENDLTIDNRYFLSD